MHVMVFEARESNSSWISRNYNFIDEAGLRTYAYSNAGAIVFPKSTSGTDLSYVLQMIHMSDWIREEGLVRRVTEIDRAAYESADGEFIGSA